MPSGAKFLYAVIPTIDDVYVVITIDGNIVWASKLAIALPHFAKAQQKVAVSIKLLNSMSFQISNIDIILRIDRHPEWLAELAITAPTRAELAQILPVGCKDLNSLIMFFRNVNMSLAVDSNPAWIIELGLTIAWSSPFKQEISGKIEYLDILVVAVSYVDPTFVVVNNRPVWHPELTVARSNGAPGILEHVSAPLASQGLVDGFLHRRHYIFVYLPEDHPLDCSRDGISDQSFKRSI